MFELEMELALQLQVVHKMKEKWDMGLRVEGQEFEDVILFETFCALFEIWWEVLSDIHCYAVLVFSRNEDLLVFYRCLFSMWRMSDTCFLYELQFDFLSSHLPCTRSSPLYKTLSLITTLFSSSSCYSDSDNSGDIDVNEFIDCARRLGKSGTHGNISF